MLPERSGRVFKKLEKQRKELEKITSGLSNEKFTEKIQEESWSISEVIQHLVLSETLSLKYLVKKRNYSPEIPAQNLKTLIRGMLLYLINFFPFKLRAPSNVNETKFRKDITREELFKQWEEVREEMFVFLNLLDKSEYKTEFYKHPIAGKVNLHHMLLFFRTHIQRHTKQIKRLIKSFS